MSTDFSEGSAKRADSPQGAPKSTDFSEGAPKRNKLPPAEPYEAQDEHKQDLTSSRPGLAEDRTIGTLVHAAGFFTWILAPLIIYLSQNDRRSLAAWHAREAFNFQASLTIYYSLPVPLFCLGFIDHALLRVAIGVPLAFCFLVMMFELVIVVWASIAAGMGQRFRIPLNIPFIRRPGETTFATDDDADFD